MKYAKLNDTTLEVETTPVVEKVTTQYTLDQLLEIRASIDVSEAEYLAQSQAEKDKFDALIAEAQKLGVKTQDEVAPVIDAVAEEIVP